MDHMTSESIGQESASRGGGGSGMVGGPPKEMSCIIISSMGTPSAGKTHHLSSLSTKGNTDFFFLNFSHFFSDLFSTFFVFFFSKLFYMIISSMGRGPSLQPGTSSVNLRQKGILSANFTPHVLKHDTERINSRSRMEAGD